MSAFRHEIIVRRESHEEETFAVIAWNGVQPAELLPALRRAVAEWRHTPQGKAACEECSHAFNIGDLANAHSGGEPLRNILARQDIRSLEIDVHSVDVCMPWSFDTCLMGSSAARETVKEDRYWLEWADDSGNPVDNIQASFATAVALVDGLQNLLADRGCHEEVEMQCNVAALLTPGQRHEIDLPTGRLYFGLAYWADSSETIALRRHAFLDLWMKQHCDYQVEVEAEDLDQRYAVITVVFSDGQPDETEFLCCETLEQCRAALESHVFQDAPPGYEYQAAVLDLDENRELEWSTQQHVLFAEKENR